MKPRLLDLFAGPGGWDVAAKGVGLDPLGVEWDDAACATRKAAGLRTLQADVAALDTADFDPCWFLIGSPPCQAWSMAGRGGGRRDIDLCIRAAHELAAGNDTRAELREDCEDPRSMLVLEPLRFARDLRPKYIALEQVPPVLPFWSLLAGLLDSMGYQTWVGILEAERYGVPQTRERAILLASAGGQPQPPRATHQRYVKGELRRHDVTFEGEILPWVSMAQALGWEEGPSPSPSPTVTGGGGETGGVEVFASMAARGRAREAVVYDVRNGGYGAEMRRDENEPAPTLTAAGLAKGRDVWRPRWAYERPATSLTTDPRGCPEPGYRKDSGERQWNGKEVRVTIEQAAALQTFPADYPWQGSRAKQHEQVGNAVPPLLAEAVLRALLGAAFLDRKAA